MPQMDKPQSPTPTPWLDCTDGDDPDPDVIEITTEDRLYRSMVPIATISIGYEEAFDAEQRTNAAFIVKAVNCHDALVEALKAADLFIANGIETGHIRMPAASTPDPAHDVPGRIRATLALAGGGR